MDEIKRECGDAFRRAARKRMEDDAVVDAKSSRISVGSSESTQSCIKFEKNVYKTLMTLNNEMSTTLCGGVKDINDVCFKIMECLHDMEKQERLYQKMRHMSADALPIFPSLLERKQYSSCTTMTSKTSLVDTKMLQVETMKITQSVETNLHKSTDETIQCDVTNEFAETQTMQEAFKQCLEAFIKDVEEVSMTYLDEVKKGEAKIVEVTDVPSIECIKIVDNDGSHKKMDGYVCRCKAVHNLHEKLAKQVEACDSYCEFQRKMAQNLKVINGKKLASCEKFCCYHKKLLKTVGNKSKEIKPTVVMEEKKKVKQPQPQQQQQQQQQPVEKKKNLASKYNDSLWFTWTPKHREKKKHRKHNQKASKKSSKFMVEGNAIATSAVLPVQSILKKKLVDEPKEVPPPPPSTPPGSGTSFLQINSGHLIRASNTLNCVDILEELTEKDVEPILSEYPRRDDWQEEQRLQDSFLYKMVYGRNNRNILEILSSVESPRVHCSTPTCERCITNQAATTTTTTTTNTGKRFGKSGQGKAQLKKKHSNRSAPDQSATKDHTPRRASDKVVSKLQKYIQDPHPRYRTTITVMPVRVFHQLPLQKELHTSGDFEEQTLLKTKRPATASSSRDKKLWANKYPKSVCQNLVSFIERQEPLPQMVEAHKKQQQLQQKQAKRMIIAKPKSAPSTKKDDRSRKMLSNMGLLASIDKGGLEMNIQKIIEMIELKIIDIISDPKKQNPDAFNEIEREITEVLRQMRSLGSGNQAQRQVRILRQENLKLTALETILDLEIIGDSVVNLTKTVEMGKAQTTTNLLIVEKEANTDDSNSEEEKCIVTAACAPEKVVEESENEVVVGESNSVETEEKVPAVNSEAFLTPFMQELKKHRKGVYEPNDDRASYHNIIEFLDNLTNMGDDIAITLNYKDTVEMANVVCEAHEHCVKDIFYPVKLYNVCADGAAQTTQPSEIAIQTNQTESKTMVVQSYLLANTATFTEHTFVNAETQHNTLNSFNETQAAGDEVVFLAEEPLKEGAKHWEKFFETCESDRAQLLNKFYGVLFTLMYFALTFDYECA